jgi:acetyl-CoA C-acetyltransferase
MQGGRAPVLVGVAQRTVRPGDPPVGALAVEGASDPLALLESVARAALEDSGAPSAALAALDAIGLVSGLGWSPRNGPRLLAERLGAHPRSELATGVGGESPLLLANHVARAIARGEIDVALIGGTHAIRSLRLARARGAQLPLETGGEGSPVAISESKPGSSERENRYGLAFPVTIYPLFENALRARRGLDPAEHARRMGRLMEPFTRVAAANPHAWFPLARSAEELVKETADNRMIAFPYPKYLNAVIETDQAAALLLCSADAARRLGVASERLVHWWGGGHAVEDPWYATERPDLSRSPALGAAARAALGEAGVAVAELAHFDLYSCFPVAVELACEALGLAEDDPRGLTVTGGLPYAGGPGNGYCLHSLAAMVERVRERGGSGLVTGNGWYLTKHSATVVAKEPRAAAGPAEPAPSATSRAPAAPIRFAEEAAGEGVLETYTVVHARSGAPERGIAVGRLADGRRFLAELPGDRDVLESFEAREGVGRAGRVAHRDGRNRFEPR